MSNKHDGKLTVTWVDDPEKLGVRQFTFDGHKIFNLFKDYPWKLTVQQKKAFDEQNPYWSDFFKDRK